MAKILHIETSTEVCSVALSNDTELIHCIEEDKAFSHASKINLFIEDVLTKGKISFDALDAVSISGGPGSYTGLRIGLTTAKAICYVHKIPLISVNTLESITHHDLISDLYLQIIPVIDARRNEVYTQIYNINNKTQSKVYPLIIEENKLPLDWLDHKSTVVIGNAAEKTKKLLGQSNITFIPCHLSARCMIIPAFHKYQAEKFEDVAYYTPFYLKNPNITSSKKHLF